MVELVKVIEDKDLEILLNLFSQIYEIGIIPQQWLISIFVILPKKSRPKAWNNYCTLLLFLSLGSLLKLAMVEFTESATMTLTTHNLTSETVLVLGMLSFVSLCSVKDPWIWTKICTFVLLTTSKLQLEQRTTWQNNQKYKARYGKTAYCRHFSLIYILLLYGTPINNIRYEEDIALISGDRNRHRNNVTDMGLRINVANTRWAGRSHKNT